MDNKGWIIGIVVVVAIALGAVFLYRQPASTTTPSPVSTTTDNGTATTTPVAGSSVEEQANAVLLALKNKDGAALAALAHPTKGVRFSPYGHISTSTDIVIMKSGLADAYQQSKKETWGSYDGSGAPITLSFSEYSKKFLYDVDFLNAPQKATNKVLGSGNTVINIKEAYPNATFVEYYFPGFDPKYEGMDWKSLRLVFEKVGTTWYLVGIVHDQWTI
jgi:hypothetical protein